MPSVASWDGKWTGADRNYTVVRWVPDHAEDNFMDGRSTKSWCHHWEDGWCACVTAHIVSTDGHQNKSDGFCGYDWMIDNIIRWNATEAPKVDSGAVATQQPTGVLSNSAEVES
jgi:hypothetical protein